MFKILSCFEITTFFSYWVGEGKNFKTRKFFNNPELFLYCLYFSIKSQKVVGKVLMLHNPVSWSNAWESNWKQCFFTSAWQELYHRVLPNFEVNDSVAKPSKNGKIPEFYFVFHNLNKYYMREATRLSRIVQGLLKDGQESFSKIYNFFFWRYMPKPH